MYSDLILALYANPAHYGALADKTHTSSSGNPSCGDNLTFDVQVVDDMVKAIGFYGESCAISRAGASLLADYALGRSPAEIQSMRVDEMYGLIGSKIHPGRVQCLLLPLQILQHAIRT